MTADTDQRLVDRVLNGDKNAFDMLVLRYQNRISAAIARLVSDSTEAEDVCQEACEDACEDVREDRSRIRL